MNRIGAFFLAPVPAAVVGGLVSWLSGGWRRPEPVIVLYLLQLYAIQALFGLAIRRALLRMGKSGAVASWLSGVLMVALPAIPYLLWAVGERPEQRALAPFVLLLWLFLGGMTGVMDWLLTRRTAAKNDRVPAGGQHS